MSQWSAALLWGFLSYKSQDFFLIREAAACHSTFNHAHLIKRRCKYCLINGCEWSLHHWLVLTHRCLLVLCYTWVLIRSHQKNFRDIIKNVAFVSSHWSLSLEIVVCTHVLEYWKVWPKHGCSSKLSRDPWAVHARLLSKFCSKILLWAIFLCFWKASVILPSLFVSP